MKNADEEEEPNYTKSTIRTETTAAIEAAIDDDWDRPFTSHEIEAIEAAIQAAESSASSSCSSKAPRHFSSADAHDGRPKTRRRLPASIKCLNGEVESPQTSGSGSRALLPCPTTRPFLHANMKMKYPTMNFGGHIVYSRTIEEVEQATLQILKLLEIKKQDMGRAILGVDIEWKPSFGRGVSQGKAAVLQICGDMTSCYVLHIIHSGVPDNLKILLEDPTSIKVGVGIDNDAVKMFHDHNVSIKSVEDLSVLANQKLGGVRKHWSLSALVETLTCKQLLKPKKIRLGNWETYFLSKAQLQYAATDAFASWYLYEVLKSYPDLSENQAQ